MLLASLAAGSRGSYLGSSTSGGRRLDGPGDDGAASTHSAAWITCADSAEPCRDGARAVKELEREGGRGTPEGSGEPSAA